METGLSRSSWVLYGRECGDRPLPRRGLCPPLCFSVIWGGFRLGRWVFCTARDGTEPPTSGTSAAGSREHQALCGSGGRLWACWSRCSSENPPSSSPAKRGPRRSLEQRLIVLLRCGGYSNPSPPGEEIFLRQLSLKI